MELKRIIKTRLADFCDLLEDIYGERIVKSFTTRDKNSQTLTMNDVATNQIAKKNFDRNDGEGCDICQDKFRNKGNFFKRNLEFPGWIDGLDFSENSAKEIMIIGIDPPKLKEQINIAFGLGLYPIDSKGNLNFDQLKKTYSGDETQRNAIISRQKKDNKLWKYLNLLFLNKLNILKPNIYITDLCKCNNATRNEEMWTSCLSKCLIKEIELINPNLIIFQGGLPYKKVLNYLRDIKKIIKSIPASKEKTDYYYPKTGEPDFYDDIYSKPCFGKFTYKKKVIHFFKIYHQATFHGKYGAKLNKTYYIKQNQRFIEKKILKEILNIE